MLEIRRNLYVLQRWWWLLILAALVGGAVAYGLTKILVKQEYQATATIAIAPPPQGPNGLYVTMLSASADAQLIPSLGTAGEAARSFGGVDPKKLSDNTTGAPSLDGQLLFVSTKWTDSGLAEPLANAMAATFIRQERVRLERRYAIIHHELVAQEQHFSALISSSRTSGPAQNWLQSQYADTASHIYQQDADARIQASVQQTSLQIAEPAQSVLKVGPKPGINAILGAILAFLVALVFAYLATGSYGRADEVALHPVLTKVGD